MADKATYKKFHDQKRGAERRGVQFLLTFKEWHNWWIETGKWEQRGVGRGRYCMARIKDTGPYSIGNIYCTTNEKNGKDIDKARCRPRPTEGRKAWIDRMRRRSLLPAGSLSCL